VKESEGTQNNILKKKGQARVVAGEGHGKWKAGGRLLWTWIK